MITEIKPDPSAMRRLNRAIAINNVKRWLAFWSWPCTRPWKKSEQARNWMHDKLEPMA